MDTLERFNRDFNSRHSFEGEDLDKLKIRWSKTTFKNIPLDWVPIVEKTLCSLRDEKLTPISVVSQESGYLSIRIPFMFTGKLLNIILEKNIELKELDKKLYNKYDYNEIQKLIKEKAIKEFKKACGNRNKKEQNDDLEN